MSSPQDFDAIVVGGGGSGLAAAVSAAENGCSVLLLESRPRLGGTTGIAVGSFTGCRTRLQRRAGVDDDPRWHDEDAGKFAPPEIEARNNRRLRRFFLEHSAETLDWLLDMGLAFHGPSPEPPNRVPRMHNVVPSAAAYISTLQSRLRRLGGTVLCDARVEALTRSGEVGSGDRRARVTGVEATVGGQPRRFTARRGVVLAAGDYANSRELIREHRGDEFAAIEGINPDATGDGHRLAASVGAELSNMDIVYGPELRFVVPDPPGQRRECLAGRLAARWLGRLLPLIPRFLIRRRIRRLLVTWQHPEDRLFEDGAILVNRLGERFCDETRWPDREIAVARQPDKIAYILLDRRLTERYSAWPHFVSTAPQIAYAYVNDYLRLRPDVTVEARSLEELAARRGLPADGLRATVEALRDEGLRGDRWVLLGPAKAYFTTTEGGAAVDRELRVLDAEGRPIPGLHAVGQNGLGGQILWGHGLHIAWALTSGRLVGRVLGRGV